MQRVHTGEMGTEERGRGFRVERQQQRDPRAGERTNSPWRSLNSRPGLPRKPRGRACQKMRPGAQQRLTPGSPAGWGPAPPG